MVESAYCVIRHIAILMMAKSRIDQVKIFDLNSCKFVAKFSYNFRVPFVFVRGKKIK